jgi:manganese transport system permease protein
MIQTALLFLTEPFQYPFMMRALIIGLLVGCVCSTLSCYMILKGWSLLGDAISHAVLPGIAIAYMLGIPIVIGAFISGLLCVLGIGYVKQQTRVKEDAVIGILFTGFFAVGLILVSRMETDVHLTHILFGSLLGITRAEMLQLAVIAGGTLVVLILKQRDLRLFCFDVDYARSIGLNTTALHLLLLSLLSLTIVASIKTVGIILVIAMLITPGSTAYLLTDRFGYMMVLSAISSLLSTLGGIYVSYYFDTSTAGTIVLIQAFLFGAAFLLGPKYGILWKYHRALNSQSAGS